MYMNDNERATAARSINEYSILSLELQAEIDKLLTLQEAINERQSNLVTAVEESDKITHQIVKQNIKARKSTFFEAGYDKII